VGTGAISRKVGTGDYTTIDPGTSLHLLATPGIPLLHPVLPARQRRLHHCQQAVPWALFFNPSWVEVPGCPRSPQSCLYPSVRSPWGSRMLLGI